MKPGDHPEFFRFAAPDGRSRESTIRLDRDGRFFHDDELVEHAKLSDALHGWIARHPDDGRYILTNGYDWTYFTVDDAPFTVRSVDVQPDATTLLLSNGDRVPLDPEGLTLDDDGALYASVAVRGDTYEARFSRFAQAQLEPALEERDGEVVVRSGTRVAAPRPRRPPS